MNPALLPPATGTLKGMRAVILAGGKGTRLHPFTANFPKILVPLADTPVIEVLMERLLHFQVTDITLTLGHLAELVEAYFERRRSLREKIGLKFIREDKPTGTAGSLARVPGLNETFLVMNGDLLTDLNFEDLVAFHKMNKAALTIATHKRTVKIDLGVIETNGENKITGYMEKPERIYQVSTGVYVYEPSVLRYISPDAYLDFPDLVLRLLQAGENVCAFPTDCLWLDIGRPDDYAQAQEIYAKTQEKRDVV
jgi:NDP-mannose synthase